MHEKKERQEEAGTTESEFGLAGSGSIQGCCTRESAFRRIATRIEGQWAINVGLLKLLRSYIRFTLSFAARIVSFFKHRRLMS